MTDELASDIFKKLYLKIRINAIAVVPRWLMMVLILFIIGFILRVRILQCGVSSIKPESWQLAGGEIGDLKAFDSKDAMKAKMKEVIDPSFII